MKLLIINATKIRFVHCVKFFLYAYIITSFLVNSSLIPVLVLRFFMWATLFLAFFYTVIIKKRIMYNKYHLWYLFIIAYAVSSYFYTINNFVFFENILSMILSLFLAFSLSAVITTNKDIFVIIKVFSISGFLLFVALLFNGSLHSSIRLGQDISSGANVFAMTVFFSLISSFGVLFFPKVRHKWFYILAMISQSYMLFLSGGRKYVLVAFFIIVMLLISKYYRRNIFSILKTIFIVLFLVSLLYLAVFYIPLIYDSFGYRIEATFKAIVNNTFETTISGDIGRIEMIQHGFQFWSEKPIFGWGHNSFKLLFDRSYGRFVYSHNNYIELMVNLGLFGLVSYYMFFIASFIYLSRIKNSRFELNSLKSFFSILLLAFMIMDFAVVSYYSQTRLHLFLSIIGIFILINKNKTSINIGNR